MHKTYIPPRFHAFQITMQHTLAGSFGGNHGSATSGGVLGDSDFSTDHGFAGSGGLLGEMPSSGSSGHVSGVSGGVLGEE